MKTKRVNRYYCEFCKKSGCAAGHMKKHERRCTMNPNRDCRVCGIQDLPQSPIAELIALLPNAEEHKSIDEWGSVSYMTALTVEANESLLKLREAANNCPMCIMDGVWTEINNANRELDREPM